MTPRTRIATAVGGGLSALVLTACAGSAPAAPQGSRAVGYPVTVSSCGVDYTYDRAPGRVLLGAPGIIKTLDALGVADSAIGYTLSDYQIDGIDSYPNLTVTTADWTPSREFLISAQPDLFLSNDEQQLLGEGAATKDDLAGIPANLYVLGNYCVEAPARSDIGVIYDDIENIGTIYNIPKAAADLNAELQARVSAAAALNPGDEDFTAGAITLYDGKVYALGGTYYAAILDALGLTNGFADLGTNFSEITPEAVLASDLDVILVTYAEGDGSTEIQNAKTLFANAPAVASGRVIGLDDTAFQSVGVAIIDVIETTAQELFGR
ncbi:ABC transporter substrate-binding protein [Microbacterium sp.]|uniref:ABC transporter substrate-binding protein n=1 Tax=Microbacterium sp. TaxID=51671 RepID=UPI003C7470AD